MKLVMKNDDFAYFNPRTPCGVRLIIAVIELKGSEISIHAPLAGCDPLTEVTGTFIFECQSTHPLRGATTPYHAEERRMRISIHAPLAGCDSQTL